MMPASDGMIRLTCQRCGVYEERESRGGSIEQWSSALGWSERRESGLLCHACVSAVDAYMPFTHNTAWSWSLIEGFEICPARHNAVKVAKTHPEAPSPALARGNEVHQHFEDRIRRRVPLPEGLHRFEPMMAAFQAAGASAEASLCLTADLRPTTWWGSGAWVRAKLDLKVKTADRNLLLLDYKTGKFKDGAGDQLRLAGAVGLLSEPDTLTATAAYVWVDEPNAPPARPITMNIETALQTISGFRKRLAPFVIAKQSGSWARTPGWACKFCPLMDCPHNKNR